MVEPIALPRIWLNRFARFMGFLKRINPKATLQTVTFKGVKFCLLSTGLYVMVLWMNGWWEYWPFKLIVCAVLSLFVGVLYEWQVPEEMVWISEMANNTSKRTRNKIRR